MYISILFCIILSADRTLLALSNPLAAKHRHRRADEPVLYLAEADPNEGAFFAVQADTTCDEPNLVIITHGWYEREPWPAWMAQAIQRQADVRQWRCGWYDWRRQARRLFPSEAAKTARDSAGPLLGRKILALSNDWHHIHLIGHSAGSWVINEAARTIAAQSSASLHLTFLDAYVPNSWDVKALGSLALDANCACWAEHYFTRDAIGTLTENLLPHAHNIDVTKANPGFNGHKFPWHWYHATIVGEFATQRQFTGARVFDAAGNVRYGFSRARESGEENWALSVTLQPRTSPVAIDGE